MNFYEYHQTGEQLDESLVYLAAKDLVTNGFNVIPIEKGKKGPANIKDVYALRARPINLANIDFYFKDRDVDIGIMLDLHMEFIDIDPKNKPGIEQSILKAIRSGWPELYEKLVIDNTPSGGCHIIYRSEITGGKSAIAKVHSKPNPLAIVERISHHNKEYVKISPSGGYELQQLNPFEIPFLSAEERNFISAICASFNEVIIPEVKKKESERADSPWKVFNDTHDWKWIREQLIDRGWSVYMDRTDKVLVKRPGNTPQQYSGIIYKDNNTLFLFTPSTEFENEKAYSCFGVYAMLIHGNDIPAALKLLASEGCGKNIYDEGQFWQRDGKRIKIKYTDLLNWFHLIGYRKYNGAIVQVINNIVEIVDEGAMKQAFLNEVEFEIKDEMFEKVATVFSKDGGMMAMLKSLDDNFISDDKDHTWLFFQNFALQISAADFTPHEYKSLAGYIWKSSIIPRIFQESPYEGCDAHRFISILGGDKKKSLQEIIGYNISRYKDPLNARATIIMEDIEASEEGESQGGSGKGLCFQFISQFRKATHFDGKSFRPSETFVYQNVEPDTDILFIDDVEKSFKFSSLFSIITGPLLVNKKNRDQVIIPFNRSAKIFITSNYFIGGVDISAVRRKYDFPVVKYFGKEKDPVDEFGRQFFAEWDRDEWLRFDNFIARCCQMYLAESNKKAIGTTTENTVERALIANTNREFVEYMDNQLSVNFFDFAPNLLKNSQVFNFGGSVTSNGVNLETFVKNENDPDYYIATTKQELYERVYKFINSRYFSVTKLTQWINRWAESRSVQVDTSYKRQSDGERMYRFINWNSDFAQKSVRNESGNEYLESGKPPI